MAGNKLIGGGLVALGALFLLTRKASAEPSPDVPNVLEGSGGSMWTERCYPVRVGDQMPDRSTRSVDWSTFVPGRVEYRCSYDPVCDTLPASFPVVDPSGVQYSEAQWLTRCALQRGEAPPGTREAPPFYDPTTGEIRTWETMTPEERRRITAEAEASAARQRERAAARTERELQELADRLDLDVEAARLFRDVAGQGTPSNRSQRVERLAETGALIPIAEPRRELGTMQRRWSGHALNRIEDGRAKWFDLARWERIEAIRDWWSLPRATTIELFSREPNLGASDSNPVSFLAYLAKWRAPVRLSLPGVRVAVPVTVARLLL